MSKPLTATKLKVLFMKYLSQVILGLTLLVGPYFGAFAQDGFKETESGLKYKFHTQNTEAKKPAKGDMLMLHLIYVINGETVFYDSKVNPAPMQMELRESGYPGDINEGLGMLHVGDSATFIVDAKDFFTKTVQAPGMPEPFKEGDKIHFDVVLQDFMTRAEYVAEQQKMYEQKEAQKVEARATEETAIAAYIEDNKLETRVLKGGVQIVDLEEGEGAQAASGKTVKVHYTGKLLNGEKFDSSYDRDKPIQIKLGANQVIQGWEVGIPELKVGGKALLIIPFDMGYGSRDAGSIPPFSTLVFEVELLEVSE